MLPPYGAHLNLTAITQLRRAYGSVIIKINKLEFRRIKK